MKSEPFWELIPNFGCEKWLLSKGSMRSFSNLQTAVNHAIIDNDLTTILLQKEYRDILKITLLEKYFPNNSNDNIEEIVLLSTNLLHEDSESYKRKISEMKRLLDVNAFEEEVYVRSGIFKREIPKLYNNTCAISGLRIDATISISMVDACHIVPFSEAYDDSISNRIALCPNLHRAFDRGLISISDNYKLILSKNFIENKNSDYSISQFEGLTINLPSLKENYPSIENLRKHREKYKK